MEKIIQKKNGYCDYLALHNSDDLFDEIDYCPRSLTCDEVICLLNKLSSDCIAYGDKLNKFIAAYPELDWNRYFYSVSLDLSKALKRSNSKLKLKSYEDTLV